MKEQNLLKVIMGFFLIISLILIISGIELRLGYFILIISLIIIGEDIRKKFTKEKSNIQKNFIYFTILFILILTIHHSLFKKEYTFIEIVFGIIGIIILSLIFNFYKRKNLNK